MDEKQVDPPKPPIVVRMLPADKRVKFRDIRAALFETGYLTGDQADVWAWQICMANGPAARDAEIERLRGIIESTITEISRWSIAASEEVERLYRDK